MTDAPAAASRSTSSRAAVWVGAVLLVGAGVLIGLALLATRSHHARPTAAVDSFQLARNLADGRGFATDRIRPLSLVYVSRAESHPDLYQAPAYPVILATTFRLFGPDDQVAASVGVVFWLLSGILLFFLASRWYSPRSALLALVFAVAAAASVAGAVAGLPYAWASLLLLAAAAVMVRTEEEPPSIPMTAGGSGLAALMILTHYLLLPAAVFLAGTLVVRSERKWPAIGTAAATIMLILLPWMIRSAVLTGSPFFTLYGYNVMAGTDSYPGDTVWGHLASPPPHPLAFPFRHPGQTLERFLAGLLEFRSRTFSLLGPILLLLGLIPIRSERDSDPPGLRGWTWGGISVTILFSAILHPEPGILLAWFPLVAILAARNLRVLLHRWFPSDEWILPPLFQWRRGVAYNRRRRRVPSALPRRILIVLVISATSLPLINLLFMSPPGSGPEPAERLARVADAIPGDGPVLTDRAAEIAWYTERTAVELPRTEPGFRMLTDLGVDPAAIYVSPLLSERPREEISDWWFWITVPTGTFGGFAPADTYPAGGMLRIREGR